MPTKKKKVTRTAKKYLKKKPHFAVWLVILGILVVAALGALILRFSQASTGPNLGVMYYNTSGVGHYSGQPVQVGSSTVWQSSVNQLNTFAWFGPYEKLTVWQPGDVQTCFWIQDLRPFGIKAKVNFDMTAEHGQKVLTQTGLITLPDQYTQSTIYGYLPYCISVHLQNYIFPADYNDVEYRAYITQGAVRISQVTRSLTGGIVSNQSYPVNAICPIGSIDAGETEVYGQGRASKGKIHLCRVDNVYVNSSIAQNLVNMRAAAGASGISLPMVIGYRSYDEQVALRQQNCHGVDIYNAPSSACSPPTAVPGTSNHGRGVAIDFADVNSTRLNWLKQTAAKFGFKNYPPEPWHWSPTGN